MLHKQLRLSRRLQRRVVEKQCGQCDGSWCPEEPRTNGVCYIDVCGCPDNWLNSWCDIEEAQFESEWCQENNFRCDQCGGYWCEGQQLVEGEYQNDNDVDNDNDNDDDVDSDADEDQEENIAEGEDQGLLY
ncbi:hypothetical protein PPERSA_02652 [Pseudocohnilembus persalinus]|uniref:Uncharacterized protein n=1 Tax=Pseudocohnilembus persalinus TaxID=266149 RepID=A0A0V0R5K6_PSEPJ|nr:hypothetical protein PPERSA_02652 [Pseudocohnilembus persalinus]|eukprot:KRX09780.1 hypothetical protein PPERSA_02652 [Pseudocohnilembus persalinus]